MPNMNIVKKQNRNSHIKPAYCWLIHCFMYLTLFVGVLCWSLICYAFLCVLSSFAISLTRKSERERKLVALLCFNCPPGVL